MKKMNRFFFVLINVMSLGSNVVSANCLINQAEIVDKKNDPLMGCIPAVISLKSDDEAENKYQTKLNEKMAKLVAIQTKQIMQELGASSSYYENNGGAFLVGSSPEVTNSCKFDFIKNLESNGCDGNKSTPEDKAKLKLIADALSEDYKSSSLMDGLLQVYGANKYGLGFENPSVNQCPISGSRFPITSQMTNDTAKLIIEKFQKENNEAAVASLYETHLYPQIDMIKEAEKFSPGFQAKFETYMKAFNPSKNNPQKYFSDFFLDNKNKMIIGRGVAHRCEQVRSSISTFVCHPLNQMASFDSKISKKLYNDYDPKKDFSDQKGSVRENSDAFKTYAHLCLAKNNEQPKIENPANCLNMKPSDDTVDNWYRCFKEGVKVEVSLEDERPSIDKFCKRYSCQSPDVKATQSCKDGGPLSSFDLKALNFQSDEWIQGDIAYMEMLEKNMSKRLQYQAGSTSEKPLGDNSPDVIKNSLSEFDLNAFGAPAVMKFAGIEATPKSILLVNEEMKNKGITASTPEEIKKIINRGSEPASKNLPEANRIASNSSIAPAFAPTNNQLSRSPSRENNFKSSKPAIVATNEIPAKTNTKSFEAPKGKSEEDRQMVHDLEQMMKDQKVANEKKGKLDSTQAQNAAFDSWAKNLRNKEASLNDRETFANIRDADYWRREADLRSRESMLGSERAPASEKEKSPKAALAENKSSVQRANKDESKKTAGKSKQDQAQEVSASSSGLILTPEKLDKLEKIDLKNFGVNIEEPFVISIRMNGKLIHVRVAKVMVKGKSFLAPRLNEDNKEVKEVVLKSPIFKEFRYFYEKEKFAYYPVK